MTHDIKKSHDYAKQRKNKKTKKLPQLRNQHNIRVLSGSVGSGCRVICLWCDFIDSSSNISRLQGFEACNAVNRASSFNRIYNRIRYHFDYNYIIINILNYKNNGQIYQSNY